MNTGRRIAEADAAPGVRDSGLPRGIARQFAFAAFVSALLIAGEWAAFGQPAEEVVKTVGAREIKVPAYIFPAPPPADLLLPQKPALRDQKPKGAHALA